MPRLVIFFIQSLRLSALEQVLKTFSVPLYCLMSATVTIGLLVSGCALNRSAPPVAPASPAAPMAAPTSVPRITPTPADEPDTECSYFYFLWGRYAELTSHFDEALEAYEKAIICDQQADYIIRKLPLIYLRLHRDQEAVAKLQHYLDRHPDENGARMLLAKIYIHQHAFDKAIAQFQRIHRHNPEEVQSLLLLSELYISRRQPKQAVKTLRRVLEKRHDSYPAHVLLARLFAGQGEVDPAVKHYRKALALNQSTELEMELGDFYLQQKRYGQAAQLYEKIVSREPDNEEAGMVLVHVYLLRKMEKKALAELERLKSISYDPGKIEMTMAGIYARKNQYEKAVEVLQPLVMRENLPKARYMLGILFFQLKKYQEALFQLQQIPVDAKDYEDALFLRVRLLRLLQRTDEAVSVLEKALLQNSDVHNADLYALLARLYQVQGKVDLGEKTFARILPLYPENEHLLYEYGLFLDQAGDQKKAMKIMQKVISLRPEHAAALNYVGYTWAEHRVHLDKALDYIRRAVKLKPKNGYIRDSLGWIYFRLGRLQEARRELLKAAKLAADDPAILDHLGDVYLASGQQKKALQAYRRALEKYTEDRDKSGVEKKIRLLEEQLGK